MGNHNCSHRVFTVFGTRKCFPRRFVPSKNRSRRVSIVIAVPFGIFSRILTNVSLSIVRVLCIYRYGTPSVHFRLLQTPKLNVVYTLGTIEIRTSRANVIKNHRAAATVTYGRDRRHDGRGIMTITFKARARVYFVNNRRSLNKPNENIKLRWSIAADRWKTLWASVRLLRRAAFARRPSINIKICSYARSAMLR